MCEFEDLILGRFLFSQNLSLEPKRFLSKLEQVTCTFCYCLAETRQSDSEMYMKISMPKIRKEKKNKSRGMGCDT